MQLITISIAAILLLIVDNYKNTGKQLPTTQVIIFALIVGSIMPIAGVINNKSIQLEHTALLTFIGLLIPLSINSLSRTVQREEKTVDYD